MGLDMYLSVEREFEGEKAQTICMIAGVTFADLERMAAADPHEAETSLYVGGWRHGTDDERFRYTAILETAGLTGTDDSPSLYVSASDGKVVVSATALYWRKANSVHSWFVQNCQDGVDECQITPIHVEQLAALRSKCQEALDAYNAGDLALAEETMTPQAGFFFGSYDVDEWWAQDMKHTIDGIEQVINDSIASGGGVSFTYRSSW